MQQIRKDLGVCPQHNRLFPELTVREHVAFFARLKGVYHRKQYAEAEEEVDQALSDIALSEKRHTLAKHLSGGMCRKLSVACAFSGGNKIVLLDEPTSGMVSFPSTPYDCHLLSAISDVSCASTFKFQGSVLSSLHMERHSKVPAGPLHHFDNSFHGRS